MGTVKQLSDSEAAYVAGIVDGEGTITLTRTHRGENRRPLLSISSTELELLSYVQSVIGAGKITKKACARRHHTPSFAYVISSRQALAVLSQISHYLHTYKSLRARLLLDEYASVTPRNGRYTPDQSANRQRFEERFFAISVRASSLPKGERESSDPTGTIAPVCHSYGRDEARERPADNTRESVGD
jgi:hypothetical protein